MKRCRIVSVSCTDPYRNQAVEELLLQNVEEDEQILYLWQNDRTVVIGRNQDAARECDLEALQSDGGRAARRLSGGGAVYHDMGNLNYTFLSARASHDVKRQTGIILDAVASFGIQAQCTGRNDLTIEGRKFSGSAYYDNGHAKLHHGTILIDTDPACMARYLTPSRQKLASKGVASVSSRVGCLRELDSSLNVEKVREALVDAFCRSFAPGEVVTSGDDTLPFDEAQITAARSRFADRGWIVSRRTGLSEVAEFRNENGLYTIHAVVCGDVITDAQVFTDSLDPEAAAVMRRELIGRHFSDLKTSPPGRA